MIYPDSLGRRKALAKRVELDSFEGMIRPGFLLGDERSALIALARDGSDRRVDRIGIRGRIRKPLGTGRASASPRPRISQARSHSSPSRRDQAARVHQALRETDESLGPR